MYLLVYIALLRASMYIVRVNHGEGDKDEDGSGGNRRDTNMAYVLNLNEYLVIIPTLKVDNPEVHHGGHNAGRGTNAAAQ